MQKEFTLAVTGDSIINRRISVYTDPRFLSLIKILRDTDVAFTHLETAIHDYEGPEVYPAAEGGGTWMRSPNFVAEELKWAGFDIVSHASNHCLDYSYGGLKATWKALDQAGLPYAGTGQNLGEAREPTYLETDKGRVALISMSSSFARWGRAGEARRDVKGRPGLNPLRFYYVVDAKTMEMVKELTIKLGLGVWQKDKVLLFYPQGATNTVCKFVEGDEPGVTPVADEDDVEGNLRSIRDARRQADYVIVQIHTHEFEGTTNIPARFIPPFARACIDAGADVFVAEGSHAPIRGIEIYKNRPIFYDPGDFMFMSNTVTRLPHDFYVRSQQGPAIRSRQWEATTSEAFDDRIMAKKAWQELNPPQEYVGKGIGGCVIAVCTFGEDKKLTGLKLHPVSIVGGFLGMGPSCGLPMQADAEAAKKIISCFTELSSPFGTEIEFMEGVGVVKL